MGLIRATNPMGMWCPHVKGLEAKDSSSATLVLVEEENIWVPLAPYERGRVVKRLGECPRCGRRFYWLASQEVERA